MDPKKYLHYYVGGGISMKELVLSVELESFRTTLTGMMFMVQPITCVIASLALF